MKNTNKILKLNGESTIYFVDTDEDMGRLAADFFEYELRSNPKMIAGFATGSTPLPLYKELIRRHKEEGLDFSKLTTFNLDEYFPIKKADPNSYDYFMHNELFDHINVAKENINLPNGETENTEDECTNYENKIKSMGGINIQILGIGENGHIGFCEPNSSFKGRTSQVELTESTISANSRNFNTPEEVPKHALSMGLGTIMEAEKIILLANTDKKADILDLAFFGPITEKVPASILQKHNNVTVIVTSLAGKLMAERLKDN